MSFFSNSKTVLLLNEILAVLVCVFDLVLMTCSLYWAKCVASVLFATIGVINLIFVLKAGTEHRKFAIFMCVGLIFAMLGDIILNLHFVIGAGLFAVGHVFFFVAYMFLSPFRWQDLLYSAVIFIPAVLLITLAPFLHYEGIMLAVCIVYALIISCMLGKSLSNLIKNKNRQCFLIFIASLMFFVSDLMLLLYVFGDLGKVADLLCLAFYYPAEIMLAFSIIFTRVKETKAQPSTIVAQPSSQVNAQPQPNDPNPEAQPTDTAEASSNDAKPQEPEGATQASEK